MRALYSSLTLADVWGMREVLFGAGDADDDGDEDRTGARARIELRPPARQQKQISGEM